MCGSSKVQLRVLDSRGMSKDRSNPLPSSRTKDITRRQAGWRSRSGSPRLLRKGAAGARKRPSFSPSRLPSDKNGKDSPANRASRPEVSLSWRISSIESSVSARNDSAADTPQSCASSMRSSR